LTYPAFTQLNFASDNGRQERITKISFSGEPSSARLHQISDSKALLPVRLGCVTMNGMTAYREFTHELPVNEASSLSRNPQ
jgi:hypothetical protein